MIIALFSISLLSAVILVSLSLATLLSKKIQFWPPPCKSSWQYKAFWFCFRIMIAGLLTLCWLDFNGLGATSNVNTLLGILLTSTGFGSALYITFKLGWENAHGRADGLTTNGCYRWSRNPIYVVSIIGMIGLGISINSIYVYVLLSLWAAMYLIAPVLEEPWLEKQYGQKYLRYKKHVPRFLGYINTKPN